MIRITKNSRQAAVTLAALINLGASVPGEAGLIRFIEVSSLPGDGGTHPTHPSANFFHIEEIEAFLTTATPADGLDNANDQALASLGATATDLSAAGAITNFGGNPANVINGLLQGGATTWTTGDVENFEAKIRIDLGANRDIGSVRIWNRSPDCCGDRLEDFTVRFFADDGAGGVGTQIGEDIVHPGQVPAASFSTIAVPEGISEFAITEIKYDPAAQPNPTVTLTWSKTGAISYIARLSRDMTNWEEDLDDGITADKDERPEDAEQMTVTFPLDGDRANLKTLFFRIEVG